MPEHIGEELAILRDVPQLYAGPSPPYEEADRPSSNSTGFAKVRWVSPLGPSRIAPPRYYSTELPGFQSMGLA